MNLPNVEQIMYAHLSLVEGLLDFIMGGIAETEFDDLDLYDNLTAAKENIEDSHKRMKYLIKKTKENSVCY